MWTWDLVSKIYLVTDTVANTANRKCVMGVHARVYVSMVPWDTLFRTAVLVGGWSELGLVTRSDTIFRIT